MDLTEFLRTLFEKPTEWKNVSNYDKQRFFFMTQRILSAAYPVQAQAFNVTNINQPAVMDYWQSQLTKIYKRRPDWLWGWNAKKEKAVKKVKIPSDEAISRYLELTQLSRRELSDAVEIFGEDAYKPIFQLQAVLEENDITVRSGKS